MDIIKDAIVYPFKDKAWTKKYLIIAVILFALMIISTIVSFFISAPLQIVATIAQNQNDPNILSSMTSMLSSFVSMAVSIITLPITFYFLGYFAKVVSGLLHKEKDPIPLHDNIFKKIAQGALIYILQMIISFPIAIVAMIIVGVGSVAGYFIFQLATNSPIFVILLVLLIVIIFILFVMLAAISLFAKMSSLYLFISTDDFGKALNVKKMIQLTKKHWKEFLSIFGYTLLFGLMMIPAFILSIFTAFIASPLIVTSEYFALAYTFGKYFEKIKEEEKE